MTTPLRRVQSLLPAPSPSPAPPSAGLPLPLPLLLRLRPQQTQQDAAGRGRGGRICSAPGRFTVAGSSFPTRGPTLHSSNSTSTQASQPTLLVWKYQGTTFVADKALEQLHAMVQTLKGMRGSRILVSGSMNGSIRLYGLGSSLQNFSNEMEFSPQAIEANRGQHEAVCVGASMPPLSEVDIIWFTTELQSPHRVLRPGLLQPAIPTVRKNGRPGVSVETKSLCPQRTYISAVQAATIDQDESVPAQ